MVRYGFGVVRGRLWREAVVRTHIAYLTDEEGAENYPISRADKENTSNHFQEDGSFPVAFAKRTVAEWPLVAI